MEQAQIEKSKTDGLDAISRRSGVEVRRDGLSISFNPATSADQVKNFIHVCAEYNGRISQLRSAGKLWMAKAVLEYAARRDLSPDEALDELEIPAIHSWRPETIMTFVRAVRTLGEDAFIDNLTDGQVMSVAVFRAPDQPDLAMRFAERRRDILADIAKSGESGKTLSSKMRALQMEFGMVPKGGRTKEDVTETYARLCYIKQNATSEWFALNNIKPSSLSEWLYHYELELTDSNVLPGALDDIEIPHFLKSKDDDFTDIEVEDIP